MNSLRITVEDFFESDPFYPCLLLVHLEIKRLRQFRSEAVRAGFAYAWRQRQYATIVSVADRLPPRELQEDTDLLMYYDNAGLRVR